MSLAIDGAAQLETIDQGTLRLNVNRSGWPGPSPGTFTQGTNTLYQRP